MDIGISQFSTSCSPKIVSGYSFPLNFKVFIFIQLTGVIQINEANYSYKTRWQIINTSLFYCSQNRTWITMKKFTFYSWLQGVVSHGKWDLQSFEVLSIVQECRIFWLKIFKGNLRNIQKRYLYDFIVNKKILSD